MACSFIGFVMRWLSYYVKEQHWLWRDCADSGHLCDKDPFLMNWLNVLTDL